MSAEVKLNICFHCSYISLVYISLRKCNIIIDLEYWFDFFHWFIYVGKQNTDCYLRIQILFINFVTSRSYLARLYIPLA